MKISFKLLDSIADIENKILDALLPDTQQLMNNAIIVIKKELPNIVAKSIQASPEYDSIMSGNLQYELGIPDPNNKLFGLIEIWSKNIEFSYKKPSISGNKIRSSFSASMIKIDFSDVLFSEYAYVQDTVRGYSLPWLEWLLLYGNTTIIPNYQVVIGPNINSRTGNAIMRNVNQGFWKVPAEFAGTISDNWITRALEKIEPDINNLLQRALS